MSRPGEKLKLLAMVMNSGHHLAAWRHPRGAGFRSLALGDYRKLAEIGERGKLDALFIADVVAVWGKDLEALSRTARGEHFEPLTLLSALAAVTQNIGLIATATTSYNEPYHIARKFASLDHLSSGRAGWNVVTSVVGDEAKNFGRDEHYLHADRYKRAEEFVDVVRDLWDSWDDDAIIQNPASGRYFKPEALHVLNHKGPHFAVRGPLNIARPPQGHPVLVQAGASEDGRNLAARIGEVLFGGDSELAPAQAFYADIKTRAQKFGRPPEAIKILPGVTPYVGRTRAEAEEIFDEMQGLLDPVVGLRFIADTLGDDIDPSGWDFDAPLPEVPKGNKGSRRDNLVALAKRETLTVRQLYNRLSGRNAVIGTASDIADQFEAWFNAYAADGFNVAAPYYPGGLQDFVDLVVPELQRRGLFRTEYAGGTLRENLGLVRPASRFAP